MGMLASIRNLYLYTYYYSAVVRKRDGKPLDPMIGFITVTLLTTLFNAFSVMILLDKYIYNFNTEELQKPLFFFFRGEVGGFYLIGLGVAVTMTYMICCRGIEFNSIPNRLNERPWLAKLSKPKLAILPLISITIMVCISMLVV